MAPANFHSARRSWRRCSNRRGRARSDARLDRSRAKRRSEIRGNYLQRSALLARITNRRRAKPAAVRAGFLHIAPIVDRLFGLNLCALKYFLGAAPRHSEARTAMAVIMNHRPAAAQFFFFQTHS